MTSKVHNKRNNRPLDTMDEVAYYELKNKYKNLEEKLGAYKKQIGGSHYRDMKVQPAQFINDNKLLFAEGNAIKYICRHKHKGEVQDLEKAKHYIDMIIERDYGPKESWADSYNKWKKEGIISDEVKLGELKKLLK
jgi:hypothetical protein